MRPSSALGTSYGPLIGTLITLAIAEFIASLYDISLLVYGSISFRCFCSCRKVRSGYAVGSVPLPISMRGSPQGQDLAILRACLRRPRSQACGRRLLGGPVLEITGLSKSYSGVKALRDISSIAPGTVHALIGPNGAGKSRR